MPSGAKPKQYPEQLVKTVSEMYSSGRTQEEIAESLSTSQKVIWNLMRRHGIQTRVPKKMNQYGEKNHMWKGEKASYKALHLRLYRRFGQPSECSKCGTTDSTKAYDWANRSGNYDDENDYIRVCRSCHWKMDSKHCNLGAYAQKGGAQCLQNT